MGSFNILKPLSTFLYLAPLINSATSTIFSSEVFWECSELNPEQLGPESSMLPNPPSFSSPRGLLSTCLLLPSCTLFYFLLHSLLVSQTLSLLSSSTLKLAVKRSSCSLYPLRHLRNYQLSIWKLVLGEARGVAKTITHSFFIGKWCIQASGSVTWLLPCHHLLIHGDWLISIEVGTDELNYSLFKKTLWILDALQS